MKVGFLICYFIVVATTAPPLLECTESSSGSTPLSGTEITSWYGSGMSAQMTYAKALCCATRAYEGCVNHTLVDAASSTLIGETNTRSVCSTYCFGKEYPYSEASDRSCYCGGGYTGSLVSESFCNANCPGDAGITCGSGGLYDSVTPTGILPWKCADSLPDVTITSPSNNSIIYTSNTPYTVPISWAWTLTTFYDVCWCDLFFVKVLFPTGSQSSSQDCTFSTSTGSKTSSASVSLPVNSASNPYYQSTIYMANYYDTSRKVSKTNYFCISKRPNTATLSVPVDGTIFYYDNLTVVLQWNNISSWGYPCETENKKFNLYLGTGTPFLYTTFNSDVFSTRFIGTLLNQSTYNWGVIPANAASNAATMTTRYFKTCFGISYSSIQTSPIDGSSIFSTNGINQTITISWSLLGWTPSPCADTVKLGVKYILYLDTNANPTTLISDGISYSTSKYTDVIQTGIWYWKIQPVLDGVALPSSQIYSFRVGYCGDGLSDYPNEECDKGIGCQNDCTCSNHWTAIGNASIDCIPKCGDNYTISNEECDGGRGCTLSCTCDSTLGYYPYTPFQTGCDTKCSDGIVAGNEECETNGQNCLNTCKCEACYVSTSPTKTNNCIMKNGAYCTLESTHLKEYKWCTDGVGEYNSCPDGKVCVSQGYHSSNPCTPTNCSDGVATGSEECDSGTGCDPVYCTCKEGYHPTTPISSDCVKTTDSNPDPQQSNSNNNPSSGLAGWIIAVIAVCATIAIAAIIALIVIVIIKKKHSKQQPQMVDAMIIDPSGMVLMPSDQMGVPMTPFIPNSGGMTNDPTLLMTAPPSFSNSSENPEMTN